MDDLNKKLLKAVKDGDEETVKILIAQGADINAKDEQGDCALFTAVYKGYGKIARLLIESGADVNGGGEAGETPLIRAVYNNDTQTLKLLIEHGAEGVDKALNLYFCEDYTETLDLLLNYNEDWEKYDETDEPSQADDAPEKCPADTKKDRQDIFCDAAEQGDIKTVEIMIKEGEIDLNLGLFYAALYGQAETVKLLIKHGADNFNDALFIAAIHNHTETVKVLIENGADVKSRYKILSGYVKKKYPENTELIALLDAAKGKA